jgi:prophage antirepressor-like protein
MSLAFLISNDSDMTAIPKFFEFVLGDTVHRIAITFREEDGIAIFKASEVAAAIGLKNVSQALKNIPEKEKGIIKVDTPGGEQDCLILTEHGVYRLLMRSNKDEAKPFQEWVVNVIVKIRTTGGYDMRAEIENLNEQHAADVNTAVSQALDRKDGEMAALRIEYTNVAKRETHTAVLTAVGERPCVYFAELAERAPDGSVLVKIGSSVNLRQRSYSLTQDYGSLFIKKAY